MDNIIIGLVCELNNGLHHISYKPSVKPVVYRKYANTWITHYIKAINKQTRCWTHSQNNEQLKHDWYCNIVSTRKPHNGYWRKKGMAWRQSYTQAHSPVLALPLQIMIKNWQMIWTAFVVALNNQLLKTARGNNQLLKTARGKFLLEFLIQGQLPFSCKKATTKPILRY